jgi:hypothetical protein
MWTFSNELDNLNFLNKKWQLGAEPLWLKILNPGYVAVIDA